MFDPNLKEEWAIAELGGIENGQSLEVSIDNEIIGLCKKANVLRDQCFEDEQSYNLHAQSFYQFLPEFRSKFESAEPFDFFMKNFSVYANGGHMPPVLKKSIGVAGWLVLAESISNAMRVSDDISVLMNITHNGLLFVVKQEGGQFDADFIGDTKAKALDIHNCLLAGASINEIIVKAQKSFRKTIGYIPDNIDPTNGLPYRGNGIAHILADDLFRTNFISDDAGNRTISLHSSKQAHDALRFRSGDRSVIDRLYGFSSLPLTSLPLSAEAVDELFGGQW